MAFVAMQNLFLGKNIKDAIDEPRVHHQLLPMTLRHEKRMNMVSNFNLIAYCLLVQLLRDFYSEIVSISGHCSVFCKVGA